MNQLCLPRNFPRQTSMSAATPWPVPSVKAGMKEEPQAGWLVLSHCQAPSPDSEGGNSGTPTQPESRATDRRALSRMSDLVAIWRGGPVKAKACERAPFTPGTKVKLCAWHSRFFCVIPKLFPHALSTWLIPTSPLSSLVTTSGELFLNLSSHPAPG